jgi:uracil-DNA glycosylase
MNYSQDINLKNLIPQTWLHYIDKSLLNELETSLQNEIRLYPKSYFFPYNQNDIFKIFNLCNPGDIRVVILGQDPYYASKYQANGIAFSVNPKVAIPPSLRNIFKELGVETKNGDLTSWVKQGVFLLNASLTVKEKTPNSHECIWKRFITHIIDIINNKCDDIIFVGWGNFALNRYSNIDLNKHVVLSSSHPSPLSCYKTDKPFIGSNVFNNINTLLNTKNKKIIDWNNL